MRWASYSIDMASFPRWPDTPDTVITGPVHNSMVRQRHSAKGTQHRLLNLLFYIYKQEMVYQRALTGYKLHMNSNQFLILYFHQGLIQTPSGG